MIFVTVGTQPQLFPRLFNEIINLIEKGIIIDEVIAQCGLNRVDADKINYFNYIESAKMLEYIEKADLIISHGGTGSIVPALKMGKKVIGVPRLAKFGEHVNDHQIELIDFLAKNKYILPVYNIEDLSEKIRDSKIFIPEKFKSGNANLIADIKDYIA